MSGGVLCAPPAWADNHVFFDGAPLVTVGRNGNFDSLHLSEPTDDGSEDRLNRLGRSLKRVWSFDRAGQPVAMTVTRVSPRQGYGCSQPETIEVDGGRADGLTSTKPTPRRQGPAPRAATPSEVSSATQWVNSVLAKRPSSERWHAQVAVEALVRAVHLSRQGPRSLTVELSLSSPDETRTLTVFAILAPQRNGRWTARFADIQAGNEPNSDGAAAVTRFLEHADLDGDGHDEVIVSFSQYESGWLKVLSSKGGHYVEVASGAGSGC